MNNNNNNNNIHVEQEQQQQQHDDGAVVVGGGFLGMEHSSLSSSSSLPSPLRQLIEQRRQQWQQQQQQEQQQEPNQQQDQPNQQRQRVQRLLMNRSILRNGLANKNENTTTNSSSNQCETEQEQPVAQQVVEEEWVDSNRDILMLTQKIRNHDPSVSKVHVVKVIETFRENLSIEPLLDSLLQMATTHKNQTQTHIATAKATAASTTISINDLAFIGVPFGYNNAVKLAQVMMISSSSSDDDDDSTAASSSSFSPVVSLRRLQIGRLEPSAIEPLCRALKVNTSLRDLRLTVRTNHHPPNQQRALQPQPQPMTSTQLCLLLQTLQSMKQLKTLKLFGVNFDLQDDDDTDDDDDDVTVENDSSSSSSLNSTSRCVCMTELVNLCRWNHSVTDLRLIHCNFPSTNTTTMTGMFLPVAQAIQASNTLQHLDLSMNGLTDHESFLLLLQTPSIHHLILSENKLGKLLISSSNNHEEEKEENTMVTRICQALATNTTLHELYLDMNPLSQPFCERLYESCFVNYQNTTLRVFWLLTPSLPHSLTTLIHHIVTLNRAGRGLLLVSSSKQPNQKRKQQQKVVAVEKLLPLLLARTIELDYQPDLLFGLLQVDPLLVVGRG